jgi:hypothetical protein
MKKRVLGKPNKKYFKRRLETLFSSKKFKED